MFVDADAGARADCNIVDSILPDFVPSKELTIPTVTGYQTWQQPAPQSWPDWALQPAPINRTQMTEYYSSEMPTNGLAFTTIKYDLVHFTGTIKVQGAQDYLAVWNDGPTSTYGSSYGCFSGFLGPELLVDWGFFLLPRRSNLSQNSESTGGLNSTGTWPFFAIMAR